MSNVYVGEGLLSCGDGRGGGPGRERIAGGPGRFRVTMDKSQRERKGEEGHMEAVIQNTMKDTSYWFTGGEGEGRNERGRSGRGGGGGKQEDTQIKRRKST